MPQVNYALVTTFLQSEGPAPVNYIPIAGIPAGPGGVPFAEAAKYYASVDAMLDDGFLSTDQEVLAAAQVFGAPIPAERRPTRVSVIARTTAVAQVDEFTVLANDDGTYRLFISYPFGATAVEAASFAAVGQSVTQIKDGLLASLALGPFLGIVTGASVDADTGSVTADVAGVPFLLTATGPNGAVDFQLDSVATSSGLYDDLSAGWKVAPFWAVVPDPTEVVGVMYEVGRWAQDSAVTRSDRRNIALLQTSDGDILTATAPNFATPLADLNYDRSFALYHPDVSGSDKMTAAWFGRYGGLNFGQRGWHLGLVNGTTLGAELNYEDAEVENACAQGVALVERLNGPADPLRIAIRDGNTERFYPVQKQAEDYWWLRAGQALINVLQDDADDGVNMDNDGIGKGESALDEINTELATTGVLDPDTLIVEPVELSAIPTDEIEIGDYQTTGGYNVSAVLIPKIRRFRASATFALAPTS